MVIFNFHTISVVTLNRKSNVDSLNCGRYTGKATAKSVAGIGVPEFVRAHNRAVAVFLCAMHGYIQVMVGRAGASKDAPGSLATGYANPVRFTTSQIGVCGGDISLSQEAAIMATFPVPDHPEITVINGQVVTSSVAIADYFLKRHDDVLKKIRALECSSEFCARNFAETSISVIQPNGGTRKLPCYQITRDGFAFLTMGFTGKRAARFKEAYITAFNQMERALNGVPTLPGPAHNAHAVYLYMTEIHRVWMAHLYPMLVASQSPLAHSLHDYINDGLFASALVDRSLNSNKEVCDE
ncbi:Rha family phage regulatory protein [Edwardsiella piscicida]|uniref:Rha family phage regulatory protein n=1 Tax=Edwardsiella piscicida TaxID=1263550 RepID=UPI0035A710BE